MQHSSSTSTFVAPANATELQHMNPDHIKEEVTPKGKVVHLLKDKAA